MSRLLVALLCLAVPCRAGFSPPLPGERAEARSTFEVVPREPQTTGRVIVEFHPSASIDRFRRDLGEIDRRAGKRGLQSIRHTYRRAMFGAAIQLEAEAVEAVRRLPYVRAVHPDLIVKACAIGATATVDAAARVNALSLGTGGEGITVGVIDTGIDFTHPVLGGGFGPGYKVAGGWDFVGDDAAPIDENGHGTHVAGIIAADSPELSGVAPKATLIAYRVLDSFGAGSHADIIAAIERSIDPNQDGDPSDHLDVINLSLGSIGTADDLPSRAVDRATAAGVVVVVAAGNEGAFASVRSPGTARTAITVGAIDDAGVVTEFTSRGPAPGSLALKPDVVAPGQAIVSARAGGGVIAANGTSMAAPHVAGVAALLLKLNPDWTPADVKSALITSAGNVDAPVFARAAGRVDAAAANQRSAFVDSAGISFGLASGRTGTWSATRTVTVTNRGTTARAFEVVATNLPAGATLVANPPSLQLAPGASQAVELRMDIDNASVAFPAGFTYGGGVELRGTETLKLPWLVVRAGRITGRFEGGTSHFGGISAGERVVPLLYDFDRGEIFGTPGTKWDLLMSAYEQDAEGLAKAVWIAGAEDREMSGDDLVVFRRSDATVQLRPDGRDVHGRNLNRQARAAQANYSFILAADYEKDGHDTEIGYVFGGGTELFLSPFSPAFSFHAIESYIDLGNRESYHVQHAPLHGLTESKTLFADHSSYVHARLRFNDKGAPNQVFAPAPAYDVLESGPYPEMHTWFYPSFVISEPVELDYYTTSESGTVASGMIVGMTDMVLPPLRGIDGKIVSAELSPSPAAYRIEDGERITIGNHAFCPVSFFGTNGGSPPLLLLIRFGFMGVLGDWQPASTMGTTWTMTAADGQSLGAGTIDYLWGGPIPAPGALFRAVREALTVGGHPSRGELEVRYGPTGSDYRAPSLTSFRIVDARGRIADAMPLNERVSVEFSAADWDFAVNTATLPLKRESTRVWFRATGALGAWTAAQPVLVADDSGTLHGLGRVPAGDVYRAELPNAASAVGGVDVRVEVEDAVGNVSTWTQSPAFVVAPGKRRALRR